MEAGEDPETIEAEMGEVLENDDMLFGPGKSGLKGMTRRLRAPEVDENSMTSNLKESGQTNWMEKAASRLKLQSTLRPRGRLRNAGHEWH